MLALIDQKKLEEAFQLLEEGKETFRSLEGKLGVSRSTLNGWYLSRLEGKIEERRKTLAEIEAKIKELEGFEREYAAKKASLEQKIKSLKEEVERPR